MTPSPAFQFYPRDYLTSRAVSLMTLEEQGAYVRLLCHAWLSDEPGCLPDDDAQLAILSGLGEAWGRHRSAIARAFDIRGGTWTQTRMREVFEAQDRYRAQSSKAGKLGAKARWGKSIDGDRIVSPMAENDSASSSSSSSANQNLPLRAHARSKPDTNGHDLASPDEVRQIVADLAEQLKVTP